MTTLDQIADFFRPQGVLSRTHQGYEFRPQQVEMARAVAAAIGGKDILLVEAGTGVGKSLAYLYPLFLWADASGSTVAVSTETKTLQKQLVEKDIPFLLSAVGLPLRAELCLGANNYLCRFRLERSGQHDLFESKQSVKHYRAIEKWARETSTGLMLELDFVPRGEVWSAVRVETDFCLRKKCPLIGDCFYYRARARQQEADVLVMNHHLFFANLAVGGAVLPPFEALVFDEAHSLEEAATKFMGAQVSNRRLPTLLGYLYSLRTGKGLLPARISDQGELDAWKKRIEKLHLLNDEFFSALQDRWGKGKRTIRLKEENLKPEALSSALAELGERLKDLKKAMPDDESLEELKGYLSRAQELGCDLDTIAHFRLPDWVYWYEQEKERKRIWQALSLAPIRVSEFLKEQVWEKFAPVILTSATLSTQGTFAFLRGRLGLQTGKELILSSPFDYRNRVLLYADSRIPDPSSKREEYEERVIQDVEQIVRLTGGGTFVLFTSYRMLDKASDRLAAPLREFICLRQGDRDRYRLLEEFKSHPHAVLFGTTSFWQGVDVPGPSLRCVIIVKLPFGVPDDPLTEARIEFIKARDGDPFREYQIPEAIIMLRQGFGRLIRHRNDYGVVAILDPRLRTKYYGRAFLASLPGCRVTSELAQVREFMEKMKMDNGAPRAEPVVPNNTRLR